MATPTEIINKALLDTHTSSDNYDPATVGIEALNIVSDIINNEIVQNVREDYFWDRLRVDTIDLQNEYNIVSWEITWAWQASTSVNIKKVIKMKRILFLLIFIISLGSNQFTSL